MNFDSGHKIADFQQSLYDTVLCCEGKIISKKDMKILEENYWVKMAAVIAPNNLVVRQLCLLDIGHNNQNNLYKILHQLESLCYDTYYTWAEGYSYWLYTKMFLVKYVEKFNEQRVQMIINAVDDSFVKTAYYRNNVLYPAPYGDLRDIPLEAHLQARKPEENIDIGPIFKFGTKYNIKSWPLGLSGHIPAKKYVVNIDNNGIPYLENGEQFVWYVGYDNKYPTKWSEWSDLLKPVRILSIFKLL